MKFCEIKIHIIKSKNLMPLEKQKIKNAVDDLKRQFAKPLYKFHCKIEAIIKHKIDFEIEEVV